MFHTIQPEIIPESPKRKKSVFRVIENIDKTPRKAKLISLVKSKESQIRELKKVCRTSKYDVKALCDLSSTDVIRNLFSGTGKPTINFLISQLRSAKRDPRSRRWSIEDKAYTLALYKRNPSEYNFLRKLAPLPSKKILLAILENIPFESGINEHIFTHIKHCITSVKERHVAVLFDEIDTKEHLEYCKKADRIVGFEDMGDRD